MDPDRMDAESIEAFLAMSPPGRLMMLSIGPLTVLRALARPADVPEPLRGWLVRVGFFKAPASALAPAAGATYRAAGLPGPPELDGPLPDARPWYRRMFGRRG